MNDWKEYLTIMIIVWVSAFAGIGAEMFYIEKKCTPIGSIKNIFTGDIYLCMNATKAGFEE